MLSNFRRPDVVAIDPGSEHVGLAVANYGRGGTVDWATEIVEPDEALMLLRYWVNGINTLIVEQWVLYGSTMAALQGSSLPEVRFIGRIEEIAQFGPQITWQRPVDVLKPARAKAERRGFEWVSPASPDHARDAEAHLWWWLWQRTPPLLQPGQGVYYGSKTTD